MMKKVLVLAALACVSAFAALQFRIDEEAPYPNQAWDSAHQIKLTITEGGSLWMANYVSSWYWTQDLGAVINMNENNYGYIDANGDLIGGDGSSTYFTFENPTGSESIAVKAYYVGDFDANDSFYFWVTTLDQHGGDIGTSNGPVFDEAYEEYADIELKSRQNHLPDLAGNTRINFGFQNIGGREFIFVGGDYVGDDGKTHHSGQPLPGVLASIMVIGGLLGGAKKLQKTKRQ